MTFKKFCVCAMHVWSQKHIEKIDVKRLGNLFKLTNYMPLHTIKLNRHIHIVSNSTTKFILFLKLENFISQAFCALRGDVELCNFARESKSLQYTKIMMIKIKYVEKSN